MSTKPPEPAAIYLAGSTPGAGPGSGPGGGPGGTAAGLLHAFPPSRPLQPNDSLYNHQSPASIYSAAAAAAAQAYIPFGAATPDSSSSAFYSALNSEGVAAVQEAWRNFSAAQTAAAAAAAWGAYDPSLVGYPYGASYGALDVRRKNATRESTSTLKAWLYEHIKNPYPTKGEKIMLAIITKMTLTQVSTWFANARRRLKKENKMQWSPRNRTDQDDDDDDDEDKNSDDADDVLRAGHCPDNDDVRATRTNVDECCDEIDVGGVDVDDDIDDRDRDFLRLPPPRSPFTRYNSVDSGGPHRESSYWGRVDETTRGAGVDCGPAAAAKHSRDSQSPQQPQRTDKPRIWSLADVATSTTTPSSGGRRSPSLPVDSAVRPAALSLPPLPAVSGGFQPWTNGISAARHRNLSVLAAAPAGTGSSPPASHRPLPPVANGLLRYAPYAVQVHPTSHGAAAVSHQLAAAAAAHAAVINAAVQARLQPPPPAMTQARLQSPISGVTVMPTASAAVGRSTSPPPSSQHWQPSSVNTPASVMVLADSESGDSSGGKRIAFLAADSSRNSSPVLQSAAASSVSLSATCSSHTAFKPVTPRRL